MNTSKTFNVAVLVLVLAIVSAGLMILHSFPDRGAQQEAVNYCRLVHDGAWPDYRHVYAQQCEKDGSVNWDYVYQR